MIRHGLSVMTISSPNDDSSICAIWSFSSIVVASVSGTVILDSCLGFLEHTVTFKGANNAFGLGETASTDRIDNLCSFAAFGSFGGGKLVVCLMKSGRSTVAG